MTTRVHVHATFTVSEPLPLFIVAVEVIEGEVQPGMFVNIPLNQMLAITIQILSINNIQNDFGISLIGLVLDCSGDEEDRSIIEAFNISNETWLVTSTGEH